MREPTSLEGASLGIGEVLARLRPEFPDVSPSKIRFLEAEGLIEPARSNSGYRRFAPAHVERLRYILTAQRDEYLPLRVIKERLDALDGAGHSRQTLAGAVGSAVAADEAARKHGGTSPAATVMTKADLLEAAGIDADTLTELEDYGLIRRSGRHYGPDALEVARACAALAKFGVGARNLRGIKAAAERDISLAEQLVGPQLRQRGAGARAAAAQDAWQIAALSLWLHSALVESGLGEAGLAGGVIVPPASTPAPRADDVGGGLRSASSR
jgi:DNA-binding transcriptional MerR regulator